MSHNASVVFPTFGNIICPQNIHQRMAPYSPIHQRSWRISDDRPWESNWLLDEFPLICLICLLIDTYTYDLLIIKLGSQEPLILYYR